MKESKTITIWLIIFTIIITFIFYFLGAFNDVNSTLFNILSNVYCGAIIGIVTSLCTYLIEKRKNINETFNNCYELYKICYSAKVIKKGSYINIPFVIDKMNVIYPKINECLSNYSSFLPARFDEYFKKMNIKADIEEFNFSKEYFIKLLDPNNEEVANDFLNKIMVVLEKYMINIDKEKFDSNFDLYKKMNDVILK